MYPDFISIGPIGTYGFFIILACLFFVAGTYIFALKRGFAPKASFLILAAGAASAAFGARVLNFFVNGQAYEYNITNVLDLSLHGFSLYGGILLGLAVGIILAKFYRINIWKFGDTAAPFMGLAIAVMRVGCFLEGCCFGKLTDLPWGVGFPLFSSAHLYQLSQNYGNLLLVKDVHPTQLYELIAAFLGSLLAVYIIGKKTAPGLAVLYFGLFFTLFRLGNHFLRVLTYSDFFVFYFYPLFYFAIAGICFWLIVKKSKQKN